MTNAEIARLFARLATMLEIDDANPFRVRAYREAARVIESQGEPVAALAAREGALEALPGIGKDLARKIRDVVETGTTALYEEMRVKVPPEVVALTELQGMGPKRVRTVMDVLRVRNRADLEAAARAGKLRELPGFGAKVEQNVLRALATASATAGRVLLAGAWDMAHALAARVRGVPGVAQVEIAGSFRRRRETIGDLDLLACGERPDDVMAAFTGHADVAEVLGRGETRSAVRLRNGLQVDLRLVPPESFGAALVYFTGSKEHNIELRRLALEQGLSLNEYGLARGERRIAGRTEEEVYQALGLRWIPPELREARGEIELARHDRLPRLIEASDLVADLHMHTDRSDGRDTIDAMVRACVARGYRYCAITEHSKSLTVARGFDEARVRRSVDEIAAARARHPEIEILHGLEVDILADGALDLDDAALALLDWVVISLHSRMDMPAPAVTERVLRALDHPAVCAMGHPTGRLIGVRPPAAFDVERVLARAAERGVAMEINAQPDRLDLSDVHARLARDMNVPLVIDTDAHAAGQLENIRYGVFVARRAGLEKDDVLNARPWQEFRRWLDERRGRPAGANAVAAKTGASKTGGAKAGAARAGGAKAGGAKAGGAKAGGAKAGGAKAGAARAGGAKAGGAKAGATKAGARRGAAGKPARTRP